MDPITHGLTGALIGKAFFAGRQQANPGDLEVALTGSARSRAAKGHLKVAPTGDASSRVAIWVCAAAAMFPDIDFLFEPFVPRALAGLELHRGVTHSFVCLPVFTVAMATLTWWLLRAWQRAKVKRQRTAEKTGFPQADGASAHVGETRNLKAAPLSWRMLAALWAAGIVSHIALDVPTSWGTMIWAPLSNLRVTLDWVFIIDFVLTGTVLLPQVVAWVYRQREGAMRRALGAWVALAAGAFAAGAIAGFAGTPFLPWTAPAVAAGLGALLLGPMAREWGFGVGRAAWCRAGLLAMVGYYGLCAGAQQRALEQVRQFAAAHGLEAQAIGALPAPPNARKWLGLVRTQDGVYAGIFEVAHNPGPQLRLIADAKPPEPFRSTLAQLPEVQTYLWFARFPVMRYYEERGQHIVDFTDQRFYPRAASAPVPFQYRVVMNAQGEVIRQGWVLELEREDSQP